MGGPEKLAKRKARRRSERARAHRLPARPGASSSRAASRASYRPEVSTRRPPTARSPASASIDGREVGARVATTSPCIGASSSRHQHEEDRAHEAGRGQARHAARAARRIERRAHARPHGRGMGARSSRRIRPSTSACARRRGCSALLGQCYGSSTWYAAMSDFGVMRKGAIMAIASPRVTSIAIGKPSRRRRARRLEAPDRASPGSPTWSSTPTSRRSTRSSASCPTCRATTWSRRRSAGARRLGRGDAEACSRSFPSRATRSTTCAR